MVIFIRTFNQDCGACTAINSKLPQIIGIRPEKIHEERPVNSSSLTIEFDKFLLLRQV